MCSRGCSSALPCRKFNKTCAPPDDDVISYGSDLNIITNGGEPATCYVSAGMRTHTHTRERKEGVCEQANRLQQSGGRTDGRGERNLKCSQGHFQTLKAALGSHIKGKGCFSNQTFTLMKSDVIVPQRARPVSRYLSPEHSHLCRHTD